MSRAPETRELVLNLRLGQRLSLNEIHEQTGVSKGTLSTWLNGHPLTAEERRLKYVLRKKRGGVPRKPRGEASKLYKLLPPGSLSRQQKARAAEAAVLLRLVLFKMAPYSSMFDGDKADWVVETPNGQIWRLQVKAVRTPKGGGVPLVTLRCRERSGYRRYRKGEFDFIVGYDVYTDTCYVWSDGEVAMRRNSVSVAPEAAERWDKLLPP